MGNFAHLGGLSRNQESRKVKCGFSRNRLIRLDGDRKDYSLVVNPICGRAPAGLRRQFFKLIEDNREILVVRGKFPNDRPELAV